MAQDAHKLAPNLVPAATMAGRMLAARGNTGRATGILSKTWKRSPHPDLAFAYAYARLGDSPRDRLERIKQLSTMAPGSVEGPIAVATAAIDAKQWDLARAALAPLLDDRISQRICTLMARIEGGEHGDTGRVREWLARAVHADPDPAWTADGVVSETWAPKSPVTGALDAFQWRVPLENLEKADSPALTAKRDQLHALTARPDIAAVAEPRSSQLPVRGPAAPAVHTPAAQPAQAATPTTASPVTKLSATPPTQATSPAPTTSPAPMSAGSATVGKVATHVASGQTAKGQLPSAPAPAVKAAVSAANASAPRAVTPTKVLTASAASQRKPVDGSRRATDAVIYTPPHAPDDPGVDAESEFDDRRPTGKAAKDNRRPSADLVRPGRGNR
jgi:HemY protein